MVLIMDIITLNIYIDATKNEILGFLKKFKPQEAEIKHKYVIPAAAGSVTAHPFFGLIKDSRETVEEIMSGLRGSRY